MTRDDTRALMLLAGLREPTRISPIISGLEGAEKQRWEKSEIGYWMLRNDHVHIFINKNNSVTVNHWQWYDVSPTPLNVHFDNAGEAIVYINNLTDTL